MPYKLKLFQANGMHTFVRIYPGLESAYGDRASPDLCREDGQSLIPRPGPLHFARSYSGLKLDCEDPASSDLCLADGKS